MKKWVQNEARSEQLVSPDVLNLEMTAARSSMATLDRSQTPPAAYDRTIMVPFAMHRIYCADAVGTSEQTTYVDTGSVFFAWEAATYSNFSSGFTSLQQLTLNGFKGGNLFCEWAGNSFIWGFCSQTQHNRFPANNKAVQLRILVNGVILSQKTGVTFGHGGYRIFGTGFYPPGRLQVDLQYAFSAAGSDDILINETDGDNMMQGHCWGNKFLAIGRWR